MSKLIRYQTESGTPTEGVYWKYPHWPDVKDKQLWIVYEAAREWVEEKWRRRQKWERVPSNRLADAKKLRRRRLLEVEQGKHTARSEQSLQAVVEDYLVNGLSPRSTPRTRDAYAKWCRHITSRLGGKPIKDVTPSDIEALWSELSQAYSPAHTNSIMGRFKAVMKRAVARDVIVANPFDKVSYRRENQVRKRRREAQNQVPLDRKEVVRLLAWMKEREGTMWHAFFMTAIDTGMRIGEMRAMKWEHLRWDAHRYYVCEQLNRKRAFDPPKDDSYGDVALHPQTIDALAVYRGELQLNLGLPEPPEEGLIWLASYGIPLYQGTPSHRLAPALKALKLRHRRFQDLRHTCASLLASEGANIRQIQHQLRHSDPSITLQIYTHLFPEELMPAMKAVLSATG